MRTSTFLTSTSSSYFFLWFVMNCWLSTSHRTLSCSFCSVNTCPSSGRSFSRRARSRWSSFWTCWRMRSSASRLSFSSCSRFALISAFLSMFLSSSSSMSSTAAFTSGCADALPLPFFSSAFNASTCSFSRFFSASSRSSRSCCARASSRRFLSSSLRASSAFLRSSSSRRRRRSSSMVLRSISRSTISLRSSICCLLIVIILRSSSRESANCLNASAF
mmetsp:Transcript_28975/g.59387  ORF Transcript_28975/g.59387 Transcript_28975/m.59387 type:complete len:219 (+) Transcript_28975:421-1077(+)